MAQQAGTDLTVLDDLPAARGIARLCGQRGVDRIAIGRRAHDTARQHDGQRINRKPRG
jgi:hypothetical protein